jgi:uncharacterized protein DUF1501
MLRIEGSDISMNCAGFTRRSFLQAGFLGLAGLSLGELYGIREAAAASGKAGKNTAVILVWLDGGPSQLETYDPKPEAPAEIRGPWGAIETSVPGIRLSETMPNQAKWAHRMAFIRSVHHDNGDHFAGAHKMLTGRWGATGADQTPRFPSVGSYVARVRGPNRTDLPAFVGVPAAQSIYLFPGYQGASYLGAAYNPFDADFDHKYIDAGNKTKIGTPRLFKTSPDKIRLAKRAGLLEKVDQLRRDVDRDGSIATLDHFTQKALNLLLSPTVREAFDLDAEPAAIAERYGESPWSRYTLLARRLVERGVTFVTVDMPNWDYHSNLKKNHERLGTAMDRAVGALVQDLDERGMLDHVLVVVMGEFGRTPKINETGVPHDPVPGRDHWGNAISVAMAGGGLRMGQAIGATNDKAEHPVERPYTPEDVLATIYHVLGINPRVEFPDREGRPIPTLSDGAPIRELI